MENHIDNALRELQKAASNSNINEVEESAKYILDYCLFSGERVPECLGELVMAVYNTRAVDILFDLTCNDQIPVDTQERFNFVQKDLLKKEVIKCRTKARAIYILLKEKHFYENLSYIVTDNFKSHEILNEEHESRIFCILTPKGTYTDSRIRACVPELNPDS